MISAGSVRVVEEAFISGKGERIFSLHFAGYEEVQMLLAAIPVPYGKPV